MKKITLLLILLVVLKMVYSQATQISNLGALSDQFAFERSKENSINGMGYVMIEGSPYLYGDFIDGEVIVNDSVTFEDIPLRLNVFKDVMEFKNTDGHILEMSNVNNKYVFNIGGVFFINQRYRNDDITKDGIFELIVDGRVKLLKKYDVKFKPATKAIGYQDATPNRFENQEEKFFLVGNEQMPWMIENKKDISFWLEQINPEVKDYIKKNKLRLKSEKSLISLVQFCNNCN